MDVNGRVHVVWDDLYDYGGSSGLIDSDIFYRMKDSNGWGLVELVSTESTDGSIEPSLDLHNGTIDVQVAWSDLTNLPNDPNPDNQYDIFYKKKLGTWAGPTTELVSTASTKQTLYPSLEWDSIHDTVHVAWSDYTDFNGDGHQDIVYNSKPSSGSWPAVTELVSTESNNVATRPDLGTDSFGRVHVVWVDKTNLLGGWNIIPINWLDNDNPATRYDVFYKSKPATCNIWSMPTDVVSIDSTKGADRPCIAIGPDDSLHIAWDDLTNISGHLDTALDIFYKIGAGTYYYLHGPGGRVLINGHGFLDCTIGVYDFDFQQTIDFPKLNNPLNRMRIGSIFYWPSDFLYAQGRFSTPPPLFTCQGGLCSNIRLGIMSALASFWIEGKVYP